MLDYPNFIRRFVGITFRWRSIYHLSISPSDDGSDRGIVDPPPCPKTSPAVSTLLALIPAMILPCLASLFYFVYLHNQFAQIIYGITKVLMMIWPIFCVYYLFRSQGRERLPKVVGCVPAADRKTPFYSSVFIGASTGIIIVLGMYLLLQTSIAQVLTDNISSIRSKAVDLGFLDHYWSFAVFLSLGNSLMEEYYWRWFVFGTLRRHCGFAVSMVIGSLAFGAHHFVVLSQYFPPLWTIFFGSTVVLGGMFWCFLYEKQKTLLGSWICHMIVDFGFLSIGYHYLTQT
jgi:uncharacterized protein